MEEGRFRLDDFELYRVAREFRKRVYLLIKQLPAVEKCALASQMRPSPTILRKGMGVGTIIQFCRLTRGSLDELIDDFNVCLDEAYGEPTYVAELKAEAYDLIRRVNSYIAYLRKSKQGDDQ